MINIYMKPASQNDNDKLLSLYESTFPTLAKDAGKKDCEGEDCEGEDCVECDEVKDTSTPSTPSASQIGRAHV